MFRYECEENNSNPRLYLDILPNTWCATHTITQSPHHLLENYACNQPELKLMNMVIASQQK